MTKPSPAIRLLAILLVLTFASCAFASTGNKNKKVLLWRVNINTASSAELQRVPGIGPKTAEKIVAMRRSVGKFRSVDDLLAVRGIGPKKLEKMRPYLTVGTTPPAPKQATRATTTGNSPEKNSGAATPSKP